MLFISELYRGGVFPPLFERVVNRPGRPSPDTKEKSLMLK